MPMLVRTKGGELKATMSDVIAGKIMNETPGKWRPWTNKQDITTNVWEITQDCNWGTHLLKIYLWVGDTLHNTDSL